MIYSTATVPVNPEGETKLTRAQRDPFRARSHDRVHHF
jgi:hypothetical protein